MGGFARPRQPAAIRWRAERESGPGLPSAWRRGSTRVRRVAGSTPSAERAEVAIARALQHHEPGRGLRDVRRVDPGPSRPSRAGHFHSLIRDVVGPVAGRCCWSVTSSRRSSSTPTGSPCCATARSWPAACPRASSQRHELIRLMLGREPGLAMTQRAPRRRRPPKSRKLASRDGQWPSGEPRQPDRRRRRGGRPHGAVGLGFRGAPVSISGARPAKTGTERRWARARPRHRNGS